MAINKNIILNHLDSAFDLFVNDSADALELLQLIDAVNSISPWQERSYTNYYDSIAALPLDSNLEGMTAVIQSYGMNNGLYLNTGSSWDLLLDFDYLRSAFPGDNYGFTSGGADGSRLSNIDKWSFASEGTATNHGDLTTARNNISGNSSQTDGYTAGGQPGITSIEKFSFVNATSDGTVVGDLSRNLYQTSASSNENNGYLTNRGVGPYVTNAEIHKFIFSSQTSGAHSADLTTSAIQYGRAGHSSLTHGYASGGYSPTYGYSSTIERFAFQNDANAVDIGNLNEARNYATGISSEVEGYVTGGYLNSPIANIRNEIFKFPFANDAVSSANIATLDTARYGAAGSSSLSNGYTMGGSEPVSSKLVDKFPFANPFVSALDVGDLYLAKAFHAGHQE
jgi:hypothetical protein